MKALIIQPGAVGDGILTLPLARMLCAQRSMKNLSCDLMAHRDKLGFLAGRGLIKEVISLEGVELHRLFSNSDTFEAEVNDPLADFFRSYDLIVSFLTDEAGHFARNLAYLNALTNSADVITLSAQPGEDFCGHVARFFMEQLAGEMPYSYLQIEPKFLHGPLIHVTSEDKQKGMYILNHHGITNDKQIIILHPGSGGKHKCWPIDNYLELARKLAPHACHTVMLLGPVELECRQDKTAEIISSQLPLLKELTLDEVVAVLSCCQGYVGNDSGITHLAAALGLDTIAIFGPTNPRQWGPLGEKVKICACQYDDYSGKKTYKQSIPPEKTNWPDIDKVYTQASKLLVNDDNQ